MSLARQSAFPRSLLASIVLHAGALACGAFVVAPWVASDAGAPERAALAIEWRREDERRSPEPEPVPEVDVPELEEPGLAPVRPTWTDAELGTPEETFELPPDPSSALARVSATVFARRAPEPPAEEEPAEPAFESAVADAPPPAADAPPPSSTGAVAARPTERPEPPYPPLSVRLGEAGTVRCRLYVDALGRVTDVELVRSSGHARLDASALETLATWRFEPATTDGIAHATVVEHDVEFRMER